MFGIAKIKVARKRFDARTAENIDMAFNTDLTLPQVAKIIRSTSSESVPHGLNYSPMVMFLREISSSPKQIGHATPSSLGTIGESSSIDSTSIHFEVGGADAAIIAVVFANPLEDVPMETIETNGRPIVKVGGRGLYSPYDTLKVFSSGVLTLDVPEWTASAINPTDTRIATFNHNLGYVPLFAPFVPTQTSLTFFYQWYWQWHNKQYWHASKEYLRDDYVQNPGGTFYVCIKYHTSSTLTEPGSGANWRDYWIPSGDITDLPGAPFEIPNRDIDLNSLDELKVVYGGVFTFVDETVYVYATASQLVIKYVRTDSGVWGWSTFPKRKVDLSYTVFYNRVDEDFDLLTS